MGRGRGRGYAEHLKSLQFSLRNPVTASAHVAIREHLAAGPTASRILVFLPTHAACVAGAAVFRHAWAAVKRSDAVRDLLARGKLFCDAAAVVLSGTSSAQERERQVQLLSQPASDAAGRLVIFATSVAESAITIPGVVAVIDSGLDKVEEFSAERQMAVQELRRAARSNLDQRRGRAGRTQPGRCVRLFAKEEIGTRPAAVEPEIRRFDMARQMVDLMAAGVDPTRVDWLDPPSPAVFRAAVETVQLLGLLSVHGVREVSRGLAAFEARHAAPPPGSAAGGGGGGRGGGGGGGGGGDSSLPHVAPDAVKSWLEPAARRAVRMPVPLSARMLVLRAVDTGCELQLSIYAAAAVQCGCPALLSEDAVVGFCSRLPSMPACDLLATAMVLRAFVHTATATGWKDAMRIAKAVGVEDESLLLRCWQVASAVTQVLRRDLKVSGPGDSRLVPVMPALGAGGAAETSMDASEAVERVLAENGGERGVDSRGFVAHVVHGFRTTLSMSLGPRAAGYLRQSDVKGTEREGADVTVVNVHASSTAALREPAQYIVFTSLSASSTVEATGVTAVPASLAAEVFPQGVARLRRSASLCMKNVCTFSLPTALYNELIGPNDERLRDFAAQLRAYCAGVASVCEVETRTSVGKGGSKLGQGDVRVWASCRDEQDVGTVEAVARSIRAELISRAESHVMLMPLPGATGAAAPEHMAATAVMGAGAMVHRGVSATWPMQLQLHFEPESGYSMLPLMDFEQSFGTQLYKLFAAALASDRARRRLPRGEDESRTTFTEQERRIADAVMASLPAPLRDALVEDCSVRWMSPSPIKGGAQTNEDWLRQAAVVGVRVVDRTTAGAVVAVATVSFPLMIHLVEPALERTVTAMRLPFRVSSSVMPGVVLDAPRTTRAGLSSLVSVSWSLQASGSVVIRDSRDKGDRRGATAAEVASALGKSTTLYFRDGAMGILRRVDNAGRAGKRGVRDGGGKRAGGKAQAVELPGLAGLIAHPKLQRALSHEDQHDVDDWDVDGHGAGGGSHGKDGAAGDASDAVSVGTEASEGGGRRGQDGGGRGASKRGGDKRGGGRRAGGVRAVVQFQRGEGAGREAGAAQCGAETDAR